MISSSFFFELRATLAGERGDLRAGTYHLQENMTYSKVLKILTTPPTAAKVTNITIIAGRTRAQINDLLRTQGVKGSYYVATRRSPLIDFAAFGAPLHTPDLEGFLFPDTYQLVEPISIPTLVTDQLKTFRTQWSHVNLSYARSKHLTPYDVLIIASMVQAEAATARDRPLIASVIYNRLRLGMPLQIDATTRYATGNYTKPLTDAQLNSRSPYNTRIHKGLTPTPIDNPGLASIEAAAHPGADELPVLRGQAVRQRRAGVHVELQPVPGRRAEVPAGAQRARWEVARALFVDAGGGSGRRPHPARRRRLAGGAQPVAGDAQRRARGGSASRLALPAAAGPAGAVRRDRGRAPGAGFRGVNVTIPHKRAALALADRPDPAARSRSAPPTR